jgi:hypothetical protein
MDSEENINGKIEKLASEWPDEYNPAKSCHDFIPSPELKVLPQALMSLPNFPLSALALESAPIFSHNLNVLLCVLIACLLWLSRGVQTSGSASHP